MVMEADMEKDEYFNVCYERGSINKANSYLDKPAVCKHLKEIIRRTVIVKEEAKMMSLDDMIAKLKQASFKRYN